MLSPSFVTKINHFLKMSETSNVHKQKSHWFLLLLFCILCALFHLSLSLNLSLSLSFSLSLSTKFSALFQSKIFQLHLSSLLNISSINSTKTNIFNISSSTCFPLFFLRLYAVLRLRYHGSLASSFFTASMMR